MQEEIKSDVNQMCSVFVLNMVVLQESVKKYGSYGLPIIFLMWCTTLFWYTFLADWERIREPQPSSRLHQLSLNRNLSDWLAQDQSGTTYSPSQQVAFIKTHKTGSTTLQTIINRFGFFHNCSFIFNKNSSKNGHFYFIPLTAEESPQKYFLPPINVANGDYDRYTDYDMLAIHVRYNRAALDRVMKKGTKYITILREPSAQWESAFAQFLFQEAFNDLHKVPEKRWIEHFFQAPQYYREKLHKMVFEGAVGRRWHYSQNSQMYDLGLEAESFNDDVVINKTIASLSKELDLVLIMEHFDESLLILKKELCWDYADIVYLRKNFRETKRTLSAGLRRKILAWNRADVLLYRHFNQTLWRKVEAYGPNFETDLRNFRKLNQHVFFECSDTYATAERRGKRIFKYSEYEARPNSTLFCQTVAEHKQLLFNRVYNRQRQKIIFKGQSDMSST